MKSVASAWWLSGSACMRLHFGVAAAAAGAGWTLYLQAALQLCEPTFWAKQNGATQFYLTLYFAHTVTSVTRMHVVSLVEFHRRGCECPCTLEQ